MPTQAVFGKGFWSEIPVTDLGDDAPLPSHWSFHRSDAPAPALDCELVGSSEVFPGVWAYLHRHRDGLRYTADDAGVFDLAHGGREFTWYEPRPEAEAQAQVYVTNVLLPLAWHLAGGLCLHASAVSFGDNAISFMAPKFHGKSTLAMASVRAGAKLLTDDTLAVTLTTPPRLLPGVHAIRLYADSANRLQAGEEGVDEGFAAKQVITPTGHLAHDPARFDAGYLLAPVMATPDRPPVRRVRMSNFEAVLLLMGQSKIQLLFDKVEQMKVMERVTVIAEQVPVYKLEVVRDFARIEEVTATLREWHGTQGNDPGPRAPAP